MIARYNSKILFTHRKSDQRLFYGRIWFGSGQTVRSFLTLEVSNFAESGCPAGKSIAFRSVEVHKYD